MNKFSRDGFMIEPILPSFIQNELISLKTYTQNIQSNWPATIMLQKKHSSTSIYDCYPLLFLNAFSGISAEDVRFLTVAARLFATSIFMGDKLIDDDKIKLNKSTTMTFTLSMHALQIEAFHILSTRLPADGKFWDRFKNYIGDYITASTTEYAFINDQIQWSKFGKSTAFDLAVGKSGVSRAVVAGLVDLTKEEQHLDSLICSINHYNIACQLLDDVSDWREDLVAGRPSLLTSLALKEKPNFFQIANQEKWMLNFSRKLYYGGYTSHVLELASESLRAAASSVDHLPQLLWKEAISFLQAETDALLSDFTRIIARNLNSKKAKQSIRVPTINFEGHWMELGNPAINYLLNQWRLGYGEARHVMKFPSFMGFSAKNDFHEGDIFQRALITDTLIDVNSCFNGVISEVIDKEISYLIANRLKTDFGGWSYFPTLPELAPDADDLAQIMQVLVRSKNYDAIEKYCLKPLKCLLTNNLYEDGSFETWIIPQDFQSESQKLHSKWAETEWGTGPDCDVMANLLYALYLYDAEKYDQVIQKGIAYLVSNQQADGSWLSSWYFGPYYGTYVILRLLIAMNIESESIYKGVEFLYQTQNKDGGWGRAGKSDALSTSLALLGLAEIASNLETNNAPLEKAKVYLHRSIQADGGYELFPLIQMPIGRSEGDVVSVLLHGSRTLTTSFVVKAIIACHSNKHLKGG